MLLIDTTPALFKPEQAERIAQELQNGDPDWNYRVKHDPTGRGNSLIEIYDEDGEFVSFFTGRS
ncbi:MAG TPA: hypothetical protein DGK91_05945 [Clostridium sp.]|nr:hypothetical protein [Clostridium sp.]